MRKNGSRRMRFSLTVPILLTVLLGGLGGGFAAQDPATTLPESARISERLFGLPGLSNMGRVAPGVIRGAQPSLGGYATLKALGIRTVINLRSRHGEKEPVEAEGMRYLEIPIRVTDRVDDRAVRRAVAALRDPANLPAFIHCALGKDRTGIVVAVYRMEAEGWNNETAEAEMRAFGFNDVWRHLLSYVRRYPPGEAASMGR